MSIRLLYNTGIKSFQERPRQSLWPHVIYSHSCVQKAKVLDCWLDKRLQCRRDWIDLSWSCTPGYRLQNSIFFCERERRTIIERKVWSECKNGEGDWWETLLCGHVKFALHTRGQRLRRFAPSKNVRKRLFCSVGYSLFPVHMHISRSHAY